MTEPLSQKPCRKKRKTETSEETNNAREPKGTTRLRRPGKLAALPTMPIDVLFEIFKYLMPHDLLKLARTTKDFRELLLNKNSTSVWKDVLGNVVGLPECPPEMSEPAWVNLLFSSYCQFCSTTTKSVEWQFRVRMCQKCAKQQSAYLWKSYDIAKKDPNNSFGQLGWKIVESLIPNRLDGRKGKVCMQSVYRAVESEYNALEVEEARKTYLDERIKHVKTILDHARTCKIWEQAQTENRGADLRHLKDERKAAIIQKLEDLGWAEDINSIRYPDSLANHKLVNRPQRLTDKVWVNIKDDILSFMQQMRNKRLDREFSDLVKTRKLIAMDVLRTFKKSRIAGNELMPGPPDFCEFEAVKGILNKPVDEVIDMSSFDPIITSLSDWIQQWRQTVDEKMSQTLKRGYNPPIVLDTYDWDPDYEGAPRLKQAPPLSDEEAVQKLKLASTVFVCRTCIPFGRDDYDGWCPPGWEVPRSPKEPMFYPQVLGHRCLSFKKSYGDFDDYSEYITKPDPSIDLGHGGIKKRKIWATGPVLYDPTGREAAEAIIKLAGLDPGVATTSDMDQLNLRFLCRDCSDKKEKAKADQKKQTQDNQEKDDEQSKTLNVIALYEWRAAVRHAMDVHHKNKGDAFIVVRAEELSSDIQAAEIALREKTTYEWACMHCLDTQGEKKAHKLITVKDHISASHKVISPVLNEDYFLHFTSPDVRAFQRPLWLHRTAGQLSVIPPKFEEQKNHSGAMEVVEVDYDDYREEHPTLENLDSYDGCLRKEDAYDDDYY